jgi:hypothetical protein
MERWRKVPVRGRVEPQAARSDNANARIDGDYRLSWSHVKILALLTGVVIAVGCSALGACARFDGAAREPDLDAGNTPIAADAAAESGNVDETRPLVGSTCNGAAACARYVFVTSEAYSGDDIGGPFGADGRCEIKAAGAATKPELANRKWQAWISGGSTSAADRLTHGTKPYWLPGGILVANSWNQLVSGSVLHQIDVDETGATLPPTFVWTGTRPFGDTSSDDCAGWQLGGTLGMVGKTDTRTGGWTSYVTLPCPEGHRLYCFEK